ncbi:MAG: family 78 glycoside hydrolase catalytic domain [Bacteroides sp.]
MNRHLNHYASVLLLAATVAAGCSSSPSTVVGARAEAMNDTVWHCSQWISAASAPVVDGIIGGGNERAADGASWFVSTLKNEKKVVNARWTTTGLGIYQLYVNGRSVGKEVLKPGFTHYAKSKRSFTYDVTEALAVDPQAENTFAVQVTPGWWADKIVTVSGHQGMVGQKVAFRGVVVLTFADGTTRCYGTNCTDWQAGVAGPVRHAAIFDGEEYDARIAPGYDTPQLLSTPEVNREFEGEILPSEGAEVYLREDLALHPQRAYVWKEVTGQSDEAYGTVVVDREYQSGQELLVRPGETLVVDFGQNCAAVPSFQFSAPANTKLTCLPAELLNDGNGAKARGMDGPEGSCHRRNLRIPDIGMRLSYIFADSKGYVAYRPQCTFFGYRYVSITATDEVRIRSLQSIPVSSITRQMETGTLETGHAGVNQLISNTVWGQRSNYLSVTTDCPQRNERLGWTADTQVFAETGSFFADTRLFFHKWMRDMRDTQTPAGGFPGVAPFGQYGSSPSEMMRVGWADAGVIVPWVVWKQFADTDIIDENWEAMERFIDHVNETCYDHAALSSENGNYQWADWLSYEPLESCGGGIYIQDNAGRTVISPQAYTYWNYLGASYWLMDARLMRDMAQATGRPTEKYEAMIANAVQYLRSRFLNSDGTFQEKLFDTMQTPALFALKNKLVEGEARERMIQRLRRNFVDHGNCLQTGFLGTSILMATLTENGMQDIAYELLLQRKNPSWLYSVDNGATTVWERWNSYMKEYGMGPSGMNSFNHYAYGCVCEWIWKSVAGIAADTSRPGFRHILMNPVPDRRLGFVRASYQSAAGLIKSEWRYEGDQWIWDFTIPQGATASVTLPGESVAQEYEAGTYQLRR